MASQTTPNGIRHPAHPDNFDPLEAFQLLAQSTDTALNEFRDWVLTQIRDIGTIAAGGFRPLDSFPIDSIYLSHNNVNPGTWMGGTWVAHGAGRVLVCAQPNNQAFAVAGVTGGTETVTLSAAQSGLPAHHHSGAAHTHGIPAHNHSMAHTHGINHGHTGSTASAGAHAHAMNAVHHGTAPGTHQVASPHTTGGHRLETASAGAHTHSVTVAQHTGNSGASSAANTGNSGALTSGEGGGGNTGTNAAQNATESHTNLQPYIVCHIWRRTA